MSAAVPSERQLAPDPREADEALRIPPAWRDALERRIDPRLLHRLGAFVSDERARAEVYPAPGDELRALALTPPEAVRAVVLGQDPYHGAGQAHGLAFSVPKGVPQPPSLRNIFRELADDLGIAPPTGGDLERWAARGVLLLNTVLTVRAGQAGSHRGRGWEDLTDAVVDALSSTESPIVFLLWGNPARAKAARIRQPPHCLLESSHPSPLSAHRGFLGSRPFSRANDALVAAGRQPIDWRP